MRLRSLPPIYGWRYTMDELEKLRRGDRCSGCGNCTAFEERIRIAEQVAECKIEKGLPVLDRKREAELLKKREEMLTDKALSSDIDRLRTVDEPQPGASAPRQGKRRNRVESMSWPGRPDIPAFPARMRIWHGTCISTDRRRR